MQPEYKSITAWSKAHGVSPQPKVFDSLRKKRLIVRDNGYRVTEKGHRLGGRYFSGTGGEKWTVWPEPAVLESINEVKTEFLNLIPCEYFWHMSHAKNVAGIMKHGLLPHHNEYLKCDISDQTVNSRRGKKEPIYNKSIHDYVPFYLNPRNAMLFRVLKEYGDDIVLFGVDKRVVLDKIFVFANRNASCNQTEFTGTVNDLDKYKWDHIFSSSWTDTDHVTNLDLKQEMMAECLIYGKVQVEYIREIRTQNLFLAEQLLETISLLELSDIKVFHGGETYFY